MGSEFSKKLHSYLKENYYKVQEIEDYKEVFEPLILISRGDLYEKLKYSDSYLYRKISGFIFELNKVARDIPEIKKFVDDLLYNGYSILEYSEDYPYIDLQIRILTEVLNREIK
ncbi:MAG: hypothetical protein N4A76_10005 [Firmicutes bacterium]|jgi:hypothetical protein|nr:hypothetical protein [Bacillota bacterium]